MPHDTTSNNPKATDTRTDVASYIQDEALHALYRVMYEDFNVPSEHKCYGMHECIKVLWAYHHSETEDKDIMVLASIKAIEDTMMVMDVDYYAIHTAITALQFPEAWENE